eukprot:3124468-Rhodomonas_salina.3
MLPLVWLMLDGRCSLALSLSLFLSLSLCRPLSLAVKGLKEKELPVETSLFYAQVSTALRLPYAESGTDLAYGAGLRYAESGTDLVYGAGSTCGQRGLRARFSALSGTENGHGVDIKKSSHKKLATFLGFLCSEGDPLCSRLAAPLDLCDAASQGLAAASCCCKMPQFAVVMSA